MELLILFTDNFLWDRTLLVFFKLEKSLLQFTLTLLDEVEVSTQWL